METKRKTTTSTAVKQRYNAAHYVSMTVQIKPELDTALRAYLEREGISRAEYLQRALAALDTQNGV